MFEAVQFIDVLGQDEPIETLLGEFDQESFAVEKVRSARQAFLDGGSDDYAWWTVRKHGEKLALFIADSKSDKEMALDLTTGQLVEV